MKRNILYSCMAFMLCVMGVGLSAAPFDNAWFMITPTGTVVQASFSQQASEIAKISWTGKTGAAYVVEWTASLQKPWRSLGTDTTFESPMRRTAVIRNPQGFYRVIEAPTFAAGPVSWRLSYSNLTASVVSNATAVWRFGDGTTNVVSGTNWNDPIVKNYAFATSERVSVTLTAGDGSFVVLESVVTITNVGSGLGPELVFNGDFQVPTNSSMPPGWIRGGYGSNTRTFSYPVLGASGSTNDRAAAVAVTNYQSGDANWNFKPVKVEPGARYEYKDNFLTLLRSTVDVEVKLQNGSYTYPTLASMQGSSNWRSTTVEFIAPTNADTVTIYHNIETNGLLTVDNVSLRKKGGTIGVPTQLPQGMMSFDFDDGVLATYLTASNLMSQTGFKATYFIVTDRIGNSGVVTWNHVRQMQRDGHEVGAHTLTHLDLATLSTTQIERQLNLCRDALLMNGIERVDSFAYPFGSYNAAIKRLAREAGYKMASTVCSESELNAKGAADLYGLCRISVHNNTTLTTIKARIDEALAGKKWLILAFHYIDNSNNTYSTTPAFFTQVLDYARSVNIRVVTASEGAALMQRP